MATSTLCMGRHAVLKCTEKAFEAYCNSKTSNYTETCKLNSTVLKTSQSTSYNDQVTASTYI